MAVAAALAIILSVGLVMNLTSVDAENHDLYHPDEFQSDFIARTSEQRTPIQTPHGAIAVRHIEYMSDNLYGRMGFTYREKEAAVWIVQELLAMGHSWDNIEIQEFYMYDPFVMNTVGMHPADIISWWSDGDEVSLRNYSQNIILTIPGQSESKIIVGAHYDSFPYLGASDNASGVALLLESAQRMQNADNYHTIVYVFFGAEEMGLVGAWIYYESLTQRQRDNLVIMINADVLFEGDFFLYSTGYMSQTMPEPGINALSQEVSRIISVVRNENDIAVATINEGIFFGSDHRVFLNAGHTVVVFTGLEPQPYEYYSHRSLAYYDGNALLARIFHTSRDCFHYINENFPGKIAEAMRTFSLVLEGLLTSKFY